eukprot:CAMPEP_0180531244 /NCGR_PEP_ID=MMETSP1036_2-20121128/62389_1 /TAXON_ID=632150 /ORGANISM="Azadinium spinosum, Strain 3D9" /LENGTH=167 /DNA_ID=CAMNT_0022545179 /DNA_START=1 /DNA_END=502 /DNA_ORIENTATION=+
MQGRRASGAPRNAVHARLSGAGRVAHHKFPGVPPEALSALQPDGSPPGMAAYPEGAHGGQCKGDAVLGSRPRSSSAPHGLHAESDEPDRAQAWPDEEDTEEDLAAAEEEGSNCWDVIGKRNKSCGTRSPKRWQGGQKVRADRGGKYMHAEEQARQDPEALSMAQYSP